MMDKNNVDFSPYLYYDESSPSALKWKCATQKHKAGDIAGYVLGSESKGFYWVIHFKGRHFKAHRVVLSLHGLLQNDLITDHIDGNSLNNKLSNLRMCTIGDNSKNKRMYKSNSSSVNGINFTKNRSGNVYIIARYYTLAGKRIGKYFSVDKLGIMLAFRDAVIWRNNQIYALNSQGAGYTERHGLQEMLK